VLNDCNGERHRVKEWEKLVARGLIPSTAVVEALPEALGDLGAASGVMMMAIAWMAFRLGYAPANRALCVLASDGPDRGGFLLEAMP
jgi:3-oxoacyl-[acyl-carrier-protein] synthase-1